MPLDQYANTEQILSANGQSIAQYYTTVDLEDLDMTYGYMQNPLFGKSMYDRVEMHVYDLNNNHLFSTHEVNDWKADKADSEGTPTVTLSFYKNLTDLGFKNGTFITVYNFHRDAVGKPTGPKLRVHSISKDRTEVRLVPTEDVFEDEDLTPELDEFVSRLEKLKNTSSGTGPFKHAAISNNPIWTQVQINFGFNKIHTATSWVVDDIFPPDPDTPHTILLKLYQPLPNNIKFKDKCWLVAEATQPVINKVLLDVPILRGANSLSGPNFDLRLNTTARVDTGFKSRDQLLGTDSDVRAEILNNFSSSLDGVRLNIDYSCFENYIRFSSAEKRIDNFVEKLKLISGYDSQARKFDYSDHPAQDIYIYEYTGSLGTKYVKQYQKRWVDRKVKLINEFDDFEKWLYFESGSKSKYITSTGSREGGSLDWSRSVITPFPKLSGSLRNDLWTEDYYDWNLDQLFDWAVHAVFLPGPNYELLNVSHSKSTDWKAVSIASASKYDKQNPNILRKTTPEFINDTGKDSNDTYLNFLDLTGQAHDIWWTYTKHFTDVSSRQHNTNYENKNGLSDDLIYHVGKASGIDLIEGDPNQDLWQYRIGKTADGKIYQNIPTGSIKTMTSKQRTSETWRRLLNNLPLLLKSKGTTIGTRGLINCYGIPESVLPIYEYGSSKKTEQSVLYENANFNYCLNFHQSQSISTYWGPHSKTQGKVTGSAITPNGVEFRIWPSPTTLNYSQSLWQVNNDVGVILHRSHSSAIKPNGQPEGFTDYGHFSIVISSSILQNDTKQGYVSASTQKAKIFEKTNTREQGDGWWTIMVNRKADPNPVKNGAYHSSSNFNYELVAMRSEYGVIDQAVSSSFVVSGTVGGTRWSSSLNDAWSGSLEEHNNNSVNTAKRSYFGGYITNNIPPALSWPQCWGHGAFGRPFSGSMQEVRYYARPLSQSVLRDHTLSPEMYSSNTAASTFDDLLARYKLNTKANHWSGSVLNPNPSSSTGIESFHPDQRTGSRNWSNVPPKYELRAEANNYPNTSDYYGYTEEVFYTNTPEAGPNSYTSNKIRSEQNNLLRQLSPTARAEKPASDKYSLDSNKLGIYFSPTDQIDKDIFDHIGGVPLDNYLGDPKEEFEDSYSELKKLNRTYWKKYNNTQNKQAYLDQLKLYDMSLFTMLENMLPARANAELGVVIKPHFIERSKLPSRGKITVTGDGKTQNIATTAASFIKLKNPTTTVNNRTRVTQTGFNIQPQTITGRVGKVLKPPTKTGTSTAKKGTTTTADSSQIETKYNSILKSFTATTQQNTPGGTSNFIGRNSPKENSTTINGVIGTHDAPIIVLSSQPAKNVGKGEARIIQNNESSVVSHTGVASFVGTGSVLYDFDLQEICGTMNVRSLTNIDGVTKTPYTRTSLIKKMVPVLGVMTHQGGYITASTPTYRSEPTASHICAYRRSEIYKGATYYYSSTVSASRGKLYETGGSVNIWAYSQSLKWAEVQDYNLKGSEGVSRLRYKGAQLEAADFNINSKATPDNGPVVSFTIGDPNKLISSDAGFGGNLSIE